MQRDPTKSRRMLPLDETECVAYARVLSAAASVQGRLRPFSAKRVLSISPLAATAVTPVVQVAEIVRVLSRFQRKEGWAHGHFADGAEAISARRPVERAWELSVSARTHPA